jgi:Mg-chelatase subunit ChlD
MADPYKKDINTNYFVKITEQLAKIYNIRYVDIKDFKVREFGTNDSIPYNIVLTVDYSGSMSGVKRAIFEGTEIFVSMKMKYDKIALATFTKDYDLKVPFSGDTAQILNIYRTKRNKGFGYFSAVYDAIAKSINEFQNTDSTVPRVLVIFSDGDDNYSKTKVGDLIDKAKKTKIHIFSVAFGYSKDDNLKHISKYTGGKFYKVYSKEDLIKVFRDIYMSLRYHYLITYKPPEFWGYHKIFSYLKVPGRKDTLIAEYEYGTEDMDPLKDIGYEFVRPILFDFDSAVIKPQSYPIIEELVDAMMTRPNLKLQIEGHTDNIGKPDYNQALSERRAKAVYDALINRGIEANRLRYRGFGMSVPVAPNDTEEGRAKNRRTNFKIIAR